MKKAIFLDRDGVINDNSSHYYIYKWEDFYFNPGIFSFLKYFQEKGYLIIIISNQGGISKGIYTTKQVDELHKKMIAELEKKGINVAEAYYCPHHSSIENCICRKPDSLLIEKSVARFNLDKSKCLLFGDSDRDIEAAEKIGIRAIKLKANSDLSNITELAFNEKQSLL